MTSSKKKKYKSNILSGLLAPNLPEIKLRDLSKKHKEAFWMQPIKIERFFNPDRYERLRHIKSDQPLNENLGGKAICLLNAGDELQNQTGK